MIQRHRLISIVDLAAACVLATLVASSSARAQDINTIAGTGTPGFAGDGGPALAASLNQPGEIAVAPDGTIFFVDLVNVRVRRIRTSGIIDTVAGSGRIGPGNGDDGPAIEADFGNIYGLAVHAASNSLYVSDTENSRVRRIDLATGIISTVAGTGVFSYTGDGGPANDAALALPMGLAVDATGNLFVADLDNCRVRRIDAVTGIITTVAGYVDHHQVPFCDANFHIPTALDAPMRVAVDRDNHLYVLCFRAGGTPALLRVDQATRLYTTVFEFPEEHWGTSLTRRSDGHLFVASETRIFQVDPDGTGPSVVAGSLAYGFAGDGGPAVNAVFRTIAGLAFTPSGALLVSDGGNNRIRAIGPPPGAWTGDLSIVGSQESEIRFSGVTTVTGSIYISDNHGTVDLGSLVSAGDVTIVGNHGTVYLAELMAVAGDLTITSNGPCANVIAGSVTSVAGDVDVESCGTGTFTIGSASAGGDATITTSGYTSVAGTTAAGSTTVSNMTGDARLTAVIQSGSFVRPVTFAIARLDPVTLLPEIGSTSTGTDLMFDPIAAYEIAFEVPVLNRDAALTFDVYPASLDAATREALLAALPIGEATLATRSEAGSRYQTFPICGELETPSAGGCVRIEMFDGNGQPASGTPAIVRFSNVVGHFSTWAVVISTASDATPPQIALPADITVEAAGPSGATATYAASVVDNLDPSPVLTCAPASGSGFPLGTTVVTCTASDVAGNSSAGSFRVRVVDTTPPVLVVPGDLTVDAVDPAGAPVRYLPAAGDLVDATPTVGCQPASGSVFPIGTTIVSCTATDHSQNAVTAAFNVRVRGAAEQIVSLIDKTRLYLDLPLLEAALKARLEEALTALLQESTVTACRAVNLFIAAITRMPSSQLSAVERSALIADADRIKIVIGCR